MVENHGRERVVTPAGRADRQTLITIDFMTVPYGQASRYALYGKEALGMGIDGCESLLCNWRWGDLHTSLSGVLPRQLTASNGFTSSCRVLIDP